MEKRFRLYLDTSVISALYDARTPERQALTKSLWENLDRYDVHISDKVIEEIMQAPETIRHDLQKATAGFRVLPMSDEVLELAQAYIAQGIFPEKYFDDALHVALASFHEVDYLISWNFTHLVKVKTRRLVALINAINNLPPVEIIAPPEL